MPILNWRELQNLVDQKQKGFDIGTDGEEALNNLQGIAQGGQNSTLSSPVKATPEQRYQTIVGGQDAYRRNLEALADYGNQVFVNAIGSAGR